MLAVLVTALVMLSVNPWPALSSVWGKKILLQKHLYQNSLFFVVQLCFKKKASTLDSGISRGFQNVLLVTFKNVSEVLLSSTVLISLQFLRFC